MNEFITQTTMERTAKALRKNNMEAYCVDTAAEVVPLIASMLKKGDTVAVGGSESLAQCGVLSLLRNGDYTFLDRYAQGLTADQIEQVFRESFFADVYFSSSNAITENGELFNVDGHSNRIAALSYGPKSVIIVAGINKIVRDLAAAQTHLETVAGPANAHRLQRSTPCATTGICSDCSSPQRICCTYTVHRFQRDVNRIKVILVGEPLGY